MKQRWQMLLGLLLSIVAFAAILRGISWDELGRALGKANYWWVLPFLLLETLSLWARGMRWRVLLEEKVGSARLFWLTNISYFLSNVLPLRIGEVVRVYLATRDSEVSGMQALSTAVLERMLDVLIVFALLFVVLPFVPQQGLTSSISYLVVAAVLMAMLGALRISRKRGRFVTVVGEIVALVAPRMRDWTVEAVDNFLESIDIVRGRRLWIATIWGVLVWLLAGLAAHCMLLGFMPEQPLYVGIFVTVIIALGIALPSVPAGIGLWEMSTVAALAVFGVNRETAFAYAVAMHVTIFVKMGILGMVGLHFEGENLSHLVGSARRFMLGMRNQRNSEA